jgi:hypothetical protein
MAMVHAPATVTVHSLEQPCVAQAARAQALPTHDDVTPDPQASTQGASPRPHAQ